MTHALENAIKSGDITAIKDRLNAGDAIPDQYDRTNLAELLTNKETCGRRLFSSSKNNGSLDSETALKVSQVVALAKEFDKVVYSTVKKHSNDLPASIHSASMKTSSNHKTKNKKGIPSFLLNNFSNEYRFDFLSRFSALFKKEKETTYSIDTRRSEKGWETSAALLSDYIEVAQNREYEKSSTSKERKPEFVQFGKTDTPSVYSSFSETDNTDFDNNDSLSHRLEERKERYQIRRTKNLIAELASVVGGDISKKEPPSPKLRKIQSAPLEDNHDMVTGTGNIDCSSLPEGWDRTRPHGWKSIEGNKERIPSAPSSPKAEVQRQGELIKGLKSRSPSPQAKPTSSRFNCLKI